MERLHLACHLVNISYSLIFHTLFLRYSNGAHSGGSVTGFERAAISYAREGSWLRAPRRVYYRYHVSGISRELRCITRGYNHHIGWCRAVIVVIAHGLSRRISRGRVESHGESTPPPSPPPPPPSPRSRTHRVCVDVGVCTICWRLRSDRHRPLRYILLRTGRLAAACTPKELTSDRRGQRRGRLNKEIDSPYIRYRAQLERRYWWWGVISTSARIVCQGRNMVAHINEKDTVCQR